MTVSLEKVEQTCFVCRPFGLVELAMRSVMIVGLVLLMGAGGCNMTSLGPQATVFPPLVLDIQGKCVQGCRYDEQGVLQCKDEYKCNSSVSGGGMSPGMIVALAMVLVVVVVAGVVYFVWKCEACGY